MTKGMHRGWKQPLAYFFVINCMKTETVAYTTKTIIKALIDVGLDVIATVCDQYNAAAINWLIREC